MPVPSQSVEIILQETKVGLSSQRKGCEGTTRDISPDPKQGRKVEKGGGGQSHPPRPPPGPFTRRATRGRCTLPRVPSPGGASCSPVPGGNARAMTETQREGRERAREGAREPGEAGRREVAAASG